MTTKTYTDEQLDRQRAMYGITVPELREAAENWSGRLYGDDLTKLAFSILSDAQEEIAMGRSENARMSINRAKYLIEWAQEERDAASKEGA